MPLISRGKVFSIYIQFVYALNVIGFQKINHFVTFDNSKLYDWNKVLHSTYQYYSKLELSISRYHELAEIFQ